MVKDNVERRSIDQSGRPRAARLFLRFTGPFAC
jgi:hypothetical protein